MHFQVAVSLLAGCAVQAVADAPAAIATANAEQSSADLLDSKLANDISISPKSNNKARRLLQKFKKRKQRAYNADSFGDESGSGAVDVGIFTKRSNAPRFLQDDYDYYCPQDTCPTELCDCADAGGSLEDCTSELQSVCAAGRLGDCVFEDYVQVYQEVYCPFVSCVGEGFRENQCDCAFYELYCERLHGKECEEVLGVASDEPDKKPFFGCDEAELANVCDQAKTCKAKGDLQGLPDLGTWKGSVMTGIRNDSSNLGGKTLAVGAAILSTFWFMANV